MAGIPGLDLFLSGGQGGLNLSTPATSSTGAIALGGFHFAPKSSTLPPIAWIALAAVGVIGLAAFLKRRR